jgi:hypothetical protein
MKELSTLALIGLGLVVGIPTGAYLQYRKKFIDNYFEKFKNKKK